MSAKLVNGGGLDKANRVWGYTTIHKYNKEPLVGPILVRPLYQVHFGLETSRVELGNKPQNHPKP